MALSKLELAVDTGKWDAGIKKAQTALRNFANSQGGVQQALQKSSDKTMKFVKMMGDMQSKAETSKGKANDYKRAIEQLSAATEHMNSAQKKVADDAIAKLTKRFHEAKTQADNLNKSLNDTKIPTGNFSGILHDVGSKLGINSNLLSVATTGTIGYAAAIGGAAVAVGAATKAWSEYNTELAKQDQITSVTTGLNRGAAEEMTNKVSALAKTYGVDFRESINAVNILMNQFGKSADESFDILSKGMRGMIAGDGGKLLQMIQQYAPAFRDAGIEASQLVAIIHNSEGGLFTDQNMNAIVMGIKNVRMMKDTTKDALRSIGIDADEMAKKLNDGTMSVFDALRQISSKIDEVGSGSQAAGEIMNDIFGKQGVTAGTNLGKAIESLNLNLDETMKQTGKVGEAMGELQRANERLNNQIRETFGYKGWEEMEIGIKTKLVGALADVLEAVNEFKEAVNETGSAAQIAWDSYTNALTAQLPIWAQLIARVREYWKEVRGGDTQEEEPAGWKGDKPTIAKPGEVNDVAEEAKKQLAQTKQGKKTGGSGKSGSSTDKPEKIQVDVTQSLTDLQILEDALATVKNSMKGYGESTDEWKEMNAEVESLTRQIDILNGKAQEVQGISFGFSSSGTGDYIKMMQSELANADFGTTIYQNIQANLQDASALTAIIQELTNKGVNDAELTSACETLWDKILGTDGDAIQSADWSALEEQINAKLAELNIEPIKLDIKTGNVEKTTKQAMTLSDNWSTAANMIQTAGNALNNFESPAAKIGGIIAQTVATLAAAYAQNLASDQTTKGNIWAFIAAAAAATISLGVTIAAVKKNAEYHAQGGIAGLGNSTFIPRGTDTIPAMLTPGETILSVSQTRNLAEGLNEISETRGRDVMVFNTRMRGRDIEISGKRYRQSFNRR